MLNKLFIGFVGVMLSFAANAADIEVKKYKSGDTFITVDGKITYGDLSRLQAAVSSARKNSSAAVTYISKTVSILDACPATLQDHTYSYKVDNQSLKRRICYYKKQGTAGKFSGEIWLNSPGGSANEGVRLANYIDKQGFTTIVGNGNLCGSACSLMWMAGGADNRWIQGSGHVGYHFAYTTSIKDMEELKALTGWIGVQDDIAQRTHYYTAWLLKFGVADPAIFVYNMSIYGAANSFFYIDKDNIDIVGGRTY